MKGFKLLEFNDISNDLEYLHKHGWDHGKYVGFDCFRDHYNMMLGGCTDWTGYPSSGKTEMLLELLFNTSEFYGWKHMLFVPDIGKSVEVMAKLIHKYTGKTFIKRYPNYITITEAFNSCSWLLEHFKILHKTDPKAKIAPIEFWDYAVAYKESGEELHTVVIDSWKDLWHDYKAHGNNYAQYLSNVLPTRNDIAEKHKLHIHTIIHPKNPMVSSKDRKIYPPSTFDMEGGAQWSNCGKCIITIHRENFDSEITDIYFRKIKPESIGKNTATPKMLYFDVVKSRYYHLENSGDRIYARIGAVEHRINPELELNKNDKDFIY